VKPLDNLRKLAKRWLKALRARDRDAESRLRRAHPSAPAAPGLRDVQHALARERGYESWIDLTRSVGPPASAPPDLERFEGMARDLLAAYTTGAEGAITRVLPPVLGADRAVGDIGVPSSLSWQHFRNVVDRRLAWEKLPGPVDLDAARQLIARQAGFDTWAALVTALSPLPPSAIVQSIGASTRAAPGSEDVPIEMRTPFPTRLQDGVPSTTTTVWDVLTAARDGDLDRLAALVSATPSLVHCDYNYMPPLHLAVREGHTHVVRWLLDRGAANPKYQTYPYLESIVTVAEDRGLDAIAAMLTAALAAVDPAVEIKDGGDIDYGKDEGRQRFQKLVNADAHAAVEAMLRERPELALDEYAFWSEGLISMPANGRRRKMIELLLAHGARVPEMTKWGREYYFKHEDIAALLLERGMSPHHRNCHGTTLLHGMAQLGALPRARLLVDHGAAIDAVDREFQSTPLGLAARWGRREMVAFLLERGADPDAAGAPWARPLTWALRKGQDHVAATLRRAGAREG
jgi:ankyrin repeat protein